MTVKSFKLKIIIPPDRPEIRQWLWTTHALFNKGVKYLLHQLFLMRRGKGWNRRNKDGTTTWFSNRELLDRFVKAGKTENEAEELAEACRQIYERNFPKFESSIPGNDEIDQDKNQEGGAKLARGLYGPLTNPESSGLGFENLEKISTNLKKAIEFPESVKDFDSIRLESGGRSPVHYNVFLEWQSDGMNKNSPLRQKFIDKAKNYLKLNVDESELLFRRNLQKVRQALGGRIFQPVSEYLKLLSEETPHCDARISPEWELGMFTQAFERLLAHEGWVSRRRMEKEKQDRDQKFKVEGCWEYTADRGNDGKSRRRIPLSPVPNDSENWRKVEGVEQQSWYQRLKEYEYLRTKEDEILSRQGSRKGVQIDGAMTKGWNRIRSILLDAFKRGVNSKEQLLQVLNSYQAENPTYFGDRRLFLWLIEDKNQFIWAGERDYLEEYVCIKPKRFKPITWTDPEPRFHPLWVRYGPASAIPYVLDENLKHITLKMLVPHPNKPHFFIQKTVEKIPLAFYEKFHRNFKYMDRAIDFAKKKSVKGSTELNYSDRFLKSAAASTKGGRLMFDRTQLEQLKPGGTPKEAYFNFSCEISGSESVSWEKRWLYPAGLQLDNPLRKEIRQNGFSKYRWPNTLLVNSREKLTLENGVRVLSINLGLRHGAGWALWGLSLKEHQYHPQVPKPMAIVEVGSSEDGEVVCAHLLDRGLLDLPGEGIELPDVTQELKNEIRSIKRELNINRNLLRIVAKLSEIEYTHVERKESFKKRANGKGFRHEWEAIKTKHVYPLEQLQKNVADAAEDLLGLQKKLEIRNELSNLPWPSLKAPDDEKARQVFVEFVRSYPREIAGSIFQSQKSLRGLPSKQRATAYRPKSLFWKRDIVLSGRVHILWKKMRVKQKDRGGLSAERLGILDDFYSLLKAWTFRPRRPGDKRHMSKFHGFAVRDRDHIHGIKTDRIKKLSFLIMARAFGYKPNLATGLWKYIGENRKELWQKPETGEFYSDEKGREASQFPREMKPEDIKRPHPVAPPCQIIVFENLAGYRFSQDRPRIENSRLMKWSHRKIFHFTRQAAQLYGTRIGMAYTDFSSQYCSFCGAAGCRVKKVPGTWFSANQPVFWLKEIIEKKDILGRPTDRAKELANVKPGDWIPWKSGEWFLCSNAKCFQGRKPVHSDENAASNIGRRFLQGIPPDFRLVCESTSEGLLRVKNGEWKGKSLRIVSEGSWTIFENANKKHEEVNGLGIGEVENEMEQGKEKVKVLFSDAISFKGIWMEKNIFWGKVRELVGKRLQSVE